MSDGPGLLVVRPRWLRSIAATFAAAVVAAIVPAAARAQNWGTQLSLTGWPLTVTNTTANDFEAGFVALGSTAFSVDALTDRMNRFPTRVTTVAVQCVAACPRSGTTIAAGLQWRRDDQATWTTLTTAYVDIEQRTLTFNGANDPWGRTMHWRYALSWTANPPAAVSQYRVRFRLLVAAP